MDKVMLRNSQVCMLRAYGATFVVVKGYLAHNVTFINKYLGRPKDLSIIQKQAI